MNINKERLVGLIKRLQNGTATEDEIIFLVDFFKYSNRDSDKWPVEISDKEIVLKELKLRIENSISLADKKKRRVRYLQFSKVFKYAAIITLLFGITYFYRQSNFTNLPVEEMKTVNHNIMTGTDKATLTLGDGTKVVLEEGRYENGNVVSDGEQIVYKKPVGKNVKNEIIFNYLTVPRGGQYFLELSDGTKVWLNSDSKLKYPEIFNEGETRLVELVYGEAYFDVSPSEYHGDSDFKVFNRAQEIQVLGTEFNIKAYKDEIHIYTTLVEGKVLVTYDNKTQGLAPNEQMVLKIDSNTANVSTIDVYNEVSWREGVFVFDERSLKDIMKVLSRWYDMEVIFVNKATESKEFNGLLRKDQKIEDILSNIESFGSIKSFNINDKKVIIE